jgi:XRE family transcriptional regulator, aerobic/anaerobic benzoate catabolism transcriptional regulator
MQYKADWQDGLADMVEKSFDGSHDMAGRLRAARARAGFTRKQLAVAAKASERYLAHLEAGTGNPSVEMLLSLANALDIAVADLLPLGGERDGEVARAAQIVRRLPKSRLDEALGWLGRKSESAGGKAGRITLIGLRGAGKTSLGAALAGRLNVPFFEISKEVERRYGGTIGVLLEMNGPGALHRYEADVLDDICHRHTRAVIAAPGAIVSNGPLYDRLLGLSWSIWLQASPEDHMGRVVAQGDLRPMTGNRAAMNDLKAILAAREADYARADARLDTSAENFATTLSALEALAVTLPNEL